MSYSIKCPHHRKEVVLYTCTHTTCQRSATICAACPDGHNDHQNTLVNFSEWVTQVSKNVEDGAKYQTFVKESMSNFDQLLKWCEDDEMHLRKVEEHCRAQKQLIQDDIRDAKEIFADKCDNIQKNLDHQLEDFIVKYKEVFKSCKLTIEESYLPYRTFSPYSNPNNLIFKMQQCTSKEANEMTQSLKRMAKTVKLIESDRSNFTDGLKAISEQISEMTYNLPVYQFQEGLDSLCQRLADELQHHLRSKLNIRQYNNARQPSPLAYKENKLHKQSSANIPSNLTNRAVSKQHSMPPETQSKSPRKLFSQPQQIGHNIIQSNKSLLINNSNGCMNLNPQDLTFKPLKKYQLDFLVSAIEVISDNIFALASSNDPYLRVFDTAQKKINTLQAHSSPITCIQKWNDTQLASSGIQVLQNNVSLTNQGKPFYQKAPFLFTLSNDAIIIWTFENNNNQSQSGSTTLVSTVPHIYHKYQLPVSGHVTYISPLEDGSCILYGDKEGGVEVYNYVQQRVQQGCLRGKHNKQITSIQILKRFDKVLIGSADQNISIWRLIYNQNNGNIRVFENTYCEQVINIGKGSIQHISQVASNLNLIVIGTQDGSLKLYNMYTQAMLLETEPSKNINSIVDLLITEDMTSKKHGQCESFCAIALSQNSKSMRFWRVQHTDEGWVNTESRLDLALTPSENNLGPKMQLVHMLQNSQNPLVLIVNEINKELLVYEMVTK